MKTLISTALLAALIGTGAHASFEAATPTARDAAASVQAPLLPPEQFARRGRGADDAPGHIRRGRGADDAPGHIRRGRGADDEPGHNRRGRGADDGPNHS